MFRVPSVGWPAGSPPYLYLGIASESPVALTGAFEPFSYDAHEVQQEPVFFSPDRLLSKQWIWQYSSGLVEVTRPIAAATYEYVRMLSPAGAVWVYGLNNDGTWYVEAFESGSPSDRRLVTTVMHKGQRLWVADPRQKPPTGAF